MAISEQDLMHQWQHGRDAEAFKMLALRHSGMVYAVCKRILGDSHSAEDAAQECFEALASTKRPPTENLAAWLHRAARNRAINHAKSRQRRRDREQRYVEENGTDGTSEMDVEWQEVYTAIDEALDRLPEELRTPILLSFFEQQTHEAIAAELGVSRGVITYRIKQGIEKLRKNLKRRGITTTAAAFTLWLGSQAAQAAPLAIENAISRIALAGLTGGTVITGATVATTVLGGSLMSMKVVGVVLGIIAVAGIGVYSVTRPEQPVAIEPPVKNVMQETIQPQPEPSVAETTPPELARVSETPPAATKKNTLSLTGTYEATFIATNGDDKATIEMMVNITEKGNKLHFAMQEDAWGPFTGDLDKRKVHVDTDFKVNNYPLHITMDGRFKDNVNEGIFKGKFSAHDPERPENSSFTLHLKLYAAIDQNSVPQAEMAAINRAMDEWKRDHNGKLPDKLKNLHPAYFVNFRAKVQRVSV